MSQMSQGNYIHPLEDLADGVRKNVSLTPEQEPLKPVRPVVVNVNSPNEDLDNENLPPKDIKFWMCIIAIMLSSFLMMLEIVCL